jgi:short-subunit dehydrogenase
VSIVIVGAGPNLGRAIARRFGREGLAVGFISRSMDKLRGLTEEVRAEDLTASYAVADIRDAAALQSAIRELADALGPVEVLEYSPLPAKEFMRPILETSVDDVRGPLEIAGLARGGMAVTVVSSELEEVFGLARRVMVFSRGEQVGVLTTPPTRM